MDNSKAGCSAFDKAVNLLAFKDRTTQEIINKLKEKGYSSDEIEDAVEKLSYYGYLNDQNYTISYIKYNTSKKGKKLIERELSTKGINKNILNHAFEEVELDEKSAIEGILTRRFSKLDINDDKSYRRIVGYFLRRGFNFENINSVVKSYRKFRDIEDYF